MVDRGGGWGLVTIILAPRPFAPVLDSWCLHMSSLPILSGSTTLLIFMFSIFHFHLQLFKNHRRLYIIDFIAHSTYHIIAHQELLSELTRLSSQHEFFGFISFINAKAHPSLWTCLFSWKAPLKFIFGFLKLDCWFDVC